MFAARIDHRVVFDKNTSFGSTLTPISLDRSGFVSICSQLIDIFNDGMPSSPKMTSKQAVSSYDEKTRQGEGRRRIWRPCNLHALAKSPFVANHDKSPNLRVDGFAIFDQAKVS